MAAGDLALSILITAQNQASNVIGGLVGQLSGINPVLGAVAGVAIGVGAAVIGLGTAAVKAAGDFESMTTTLVTGAGESASNLDLVRKGILGLSVATGTSTKQLTDGMFMIESSGYHGAAGLNVLKVAAQGAKVGNADLGVTANAVTTILTDYHMSGDQAAQAMNALTTTVASGKTHLQDLAGAMGSVLPLASSLHITFPQVGGAIAVMTNAGMSAQRASMNLANAIRSLAAPGSTATKALTEVGISTQHLNDVLSHQGLQAALQMINEDVGKKFPAGSSQWTAAMKAIMGGATGLNVALMLGGKNMDTYKSNIANITAAMSPAQKAVMGWSAVQQDANLKFDQAKAALNVLGIVVGTKLLPAVSQITSVITPLIVAFANWISSGQAASQIHSVFAQVLARVNAVLTTLAPVFNAVWLVLKSIGAFLASTFVPVWNQLVSTVRSQLIPVWNDLVKSITPILPQLKMFAQFLGAVVGVAVILLISIIGGLIRVFAGMLSGLITAFSGIVQIVSGAIKIVSGIIAVFIDLATGNFGKLKTDIGTIFSGIGTIITGAWNLFKGIFQAGIGAITGFVSGFKTTIVGIFQNLSDILVGHSIIPNMITAIVSWIGQLPGRAGAFLRQLLSVAIGLFTALASAAVLKAQQIVSGIVGWIGQLPGRAGSILNRLPGIVTGALGAAASAALAGGANIVNSIASGIEGAIGAVGNAIGDVVGFISAHLPHSPAKVGPLRSLPVQAKLISRQIGEGMLAGKSHIARAMTQLTQPITMGLNGAAISTRSNNAFALSGGTHTIIVQMHPSDVYLDRQKVGESVMKYANRQVHATGAYRNG